MTPFGFLLDKNRRVALALSLCALVVVVSNAFGQVTPGQLQQAMQNPEVIRQRLMESGLSADQIRSRLRARSEEHTSELQSRRELVCRLLLEKKKKATKTANEPQLQLGTADSERHTANSGRR